MHTRLVAALHLLTPAIARTPLPTGTPSPSCMMNGQPCPLPVGWEVDWSLYNSTIAMPELQGGNNSVSFTPAPGHHWGAVSLDWSVGRATWLQPNRSQSTCEATSAANCRALKAAGQVKRCGIYHNIELALEWVESARAAMRSPASAGWFLQYRNGTIFDQPRAEGSQYFIDWRNPAAAAYFVASIVNTTVALDVDLTFTDDRDGCCVEHAAVPQELGLSAAEVAALQFATQSAGQVLASALAAVGKTCWDCLAGYNLGVRPTAATCAPTMRALCDPAAQGRSMLMGYSSAAGVDLNQSLAGFLVSRPPIAFFGSRWQDAAWSPLFNLDVGVPLGLCQEGPPGVFSRQWSKGRAALDCNAWAAELPFEMLEVEAAP